VLELGTEDMVAVLDAVDDGGELATHPAVHTGAEDRGDLVAGEPPQTEFAAAFEQPVDGEVPLEDEVAAVFDLGDRIKRETLSRFRSLAENFGPRISVQ
jgi:hypothetical protein